MSQAPSQKIIGSFLKRRTKWSDHQKVNATQILNRFCAYLADVHGVDDIREADGDMCAEFIAWRLGHTGRQGKPIAGSTVHKDWQTLGWFYEWAVKDGEVESSALKPRGPMHGIDSPGISDPDPDRVHACDQATFDLLMASFDRRSWLDCRNAAITSIMFRSGLRCSEVCRVDVFALDVDGDRPSVHILGKNGKYRRIGIAAETAEWIDRYVRRARQAGVDLGDEGPLFVKSWNGDRRSLADPRITSRTITDWLDRKGEALGIEISTHMFRRAYPRMAKRNGMSNQAIRRTAGWKSEKMLERYLGEEADDLALDEFHAADPTRRPDGAASRARPKATRALRRVS